MTHTEPQVSEGNRVYIDEQIDDLQKALEKAEAAIDKLRDTSKLRATRAESLKAPQHTEMTLGRSET